MLMEAILPSLTFNTLLVETQECGWAKLDVEKTRAHKIDAYPINRICILLNLIRNMFQMI